LVFWRPATGMKWE